MVVVIGAWHGYCGRLTAFHHGWLHLVTIWWEKHDIWCKHMLKKQTARRNRHVSAKLLYHLLYFKNIAIGIAVWQFGAHLRSAGRFASNATHCKFDVEVCNCKILSWMTWLSSPEYFWARFDLCALIKYAMLSSVLMFPWQLLQFYHHKYGKIAFTDRLALGASYRGSRVLYGTSRLRILNIRTFKDP